MKKYEVLEDNAGGLHLAVFDDGWNVEYLSSGYEYNPGSLMEDIEALKEGFPVHGRWEGNSREAQAEYDRMIAWGPSGVQIVADHDGIYTERMGRAAMMEIVNRMGIEERYTMGMNLLGYERVELPEGSAGTVGFRRMDDKNNHGDTQGWTFEFDNWPMVGKMFENLDTLPFPGNPEQMERIYGLTHPVGRIQFAAAEDGKIVYQSSDSTTVIRRYLSSGNDSGKAVGYVLGDGEFVSLAHREDNRHVVPENDFATLASFSPEATYEEISILMDYREQMDRQLTAENAKTDIHQALSQILQKAEQDMARQHSVWGSWFGRVACSTRPQDYIKIDVTGYKAQGAIQCSLTVVHANAVVERQDNWSQVPEDRRYVTADTLKECFHGIEEFVRQHTEGNLQLLDTEIKQGFTLYSPDGALSLREHYHLLEEKGYEAFPEDPAMNQLQNELEHARSAETRETSQSRNPHPQKAPHPKMRR